MSLMSDRQIIDAVKKHGMIEPFVDHIVESDGGTKILSYGLGSYGYDLRLSPKDFRISKHLPNQLISPLSFSPDAMDPVELQSDDEGDYFVLPAKTGGLGVAVEALRMPDDVTGICFTKSTYARCLVQVLVTPAEAGWANKSKDGSHLTLEFANHSENDCKLFANQGILQIQFHKGEECVTPYHRRIGGGTYSVQPEMVVLPKAATL